jgi:hypothetical protein
MSNTNGLLASSDVCATGDPESNFFVRVGDPIVVPDPLQIISPNGQEVLSIGINNAGQANMTNAGGTLGVVAQDNLVLSSTTGNTAITTNGLLITSVGNENHNITGSVSITASAGETHNITGNFGVTASAGETHNITGNLGMTATGTGSVISSGNMTIGGQNVFLNGVNVNANGAIIARPAPGLPTDNGSGSVTMVNGLASTVPVSYTMTANGNQPNAGATVGNMDINSFTGSGANLCMSMSPQGVISAGSRFDAPNMRVTNPTTQAVTPGQIGGGSATQGNLRPLLIDITTGQLTYPSNALIRFFPIATPDANNSPQKIIDPNGGTYDNSWICCVAGFINGSIDRSYACWTIAPPFTTLDPVWYVEYDHAGTNGNNRVWILAISTALTGTVNYNT